MEVIVISSQTIHEESFSKPSLPNMHNNKAFKMEYLAPIEAINLVATLQHKIHRLTNVAFQAEFLLKYVHYYKDFSCATQQKCQENAMVSTR